MPDHESLPRRTGRAHPDDAIRWLSLGPASRLLGVDPDTLRRWADEGRVDAYVTPGRHRRFDRRTIERLASSRRPGARPLASLGASADRLTRAYRRSYATGQPAHRVAADDTEQLERYRQDGRRLVDALVAHLDADPTDTAARQAAVDQATAVVDDLARRMSAAGTSLTEAVALFVAARRPFMTELAGLGRRRALDASRLAGLYEDASVLLDRLLLRLIASYHDAAR
ncbi:MAG TPA: helix-turn-helix domain-containing protein [Candidatus Limnocylindrales bacterium]|nr:helix-turn-helix domain-containing protein [Candidatus Limnocylindrales bacterium]